MATTNEQIVDPYKPLTIGKQSKQYANPYLTVIPKQHSIFTLAIPLYSTLDPASPGAQTALHTWSYQEPPSHDKTTMQPSLSTVFDMPHMELELYGNQFLYRSTERAGRKFKAKETIEL
ncbi:hypothetical protein ID866_4337 [Astraeus odoratus]|nr:hypothetical protein ID866_4337 [Astraeus odoratus]